jgi:squalene-hopene/tetraprenyl-beta-curcumene cyclase
VKIRGLQEALANTRAALLAERVEDGYWVGELSASALSTATAVQALHLVSDPDDADLIASGLRWLMTNQNADGGWGDTVLSHSNISTTLLCWSALGLAGGDETSETEAGAERWIRSTTGSLDPADLARAVGDRYGKDRTFAVPIMMMCALAGRLGTGASAWRRVLPLPFEVAAFPRRWFGALRLPVVSYALPALIAIGYTRFKNLPPALPLRAIRSRAWGRASRVLEEIQPSSGGYLEATPLTSFVTMALAGAGETDHPVVAKAVGFLRASARDDGSWPIDSDLATWGTTLAVKGLAGARAFGADDRKRVMGWLLNQQYRETHPFTNSPPGGWAWTDLPGGVPDADDTPGALLALDVLAGDRPDSQIVAAAEAAIAWLLQLQNRDGGIPTFCKGWGALPFDRSSPDLTAHTLRAWAAWLPRIDPVLAARVERAAERALAYLDRCQTEGGAWSPLWFGNQHLAAENNLTYGTAMVVQALAIAQPGGKMLERGVSWLEGSQNDDGGWGGGLCGESPSSIEETAVALEALAVAGGDRDAIGQGTVWLIRETDGGRQFPPSPIGFYFAKLWYYERLYPMVWSASALAKVAKFGK